WTPLHWSTCLPPPRSLPPPGYAGPLRTGAAAMSPLCLPIATLALALLPPLAAPTPPAAGRAETPALRRDTRMEWWREARFGMFIHWGLYAIPAGEWDGEPVPGVGEWIMHHGEIPA